MADLNNVVLTGRLVRAPVLRHLPSGTLMATFTIASNHRYKDKTGAYQDEVAFMACIAFGGWAQGLADRTKGELLLVAGRLRTQVWEQDGEKRSQLGLVCDSLRFFSTSPSFSAGSKESDPGIAPGSVSITAEDEVPF